MAKKHPKGLDRTRKPSTLPKGWTKKVHLKATKMSVTLKVPEESPDYPECSTYVVDQIQRVIQDAIDAKTNHIFIILSLKHKVYGEKDAATGMTNGIMEIVSCAVYDLKYLSVADISYNPALGTGQLQVRDIHYVTIEKRTAWEFLQLLDKKYIKSKGEEPWLKLARKHAWIKEE